MDLTVKAPLVVTANIAPLLTRIRQHGSPAPATWLRGFDGIPTSERPCGEAVTSLLNSSHDTTGRESLASRGHHIALPADGSVDRAQ